MIGSVIVSLMISSKFVLSAFTGMTDNCYLTMIVPRDKIKNTCVAEENMRKRIVSLESRLSQFWDRLTQHEIRLINQDAKHDKNFAKFAKRIKILSGDVAKARQTSGFGNFFGKLIKQPYSKYRNKDGVEYKSDNADGKKGDRAEDYYRFNAESVREPAKEPGQTFGQSKSSSSSSVEVVYVMAFDILRPYVDEQIEKFRRQVFARLDYEIKPVASAFKSVEEAASKPHNSYASSFGRTWAGDKMNARQLHINTLALGKVLPEMTRIHEMLYENGENERRLKDELSRLKDRTLDELLNATSSKQTLEVSVAKLEGENKRLELNEKFLLHLEKFRAKVNEEIKQIKSKQQDFSAGDDTRARMAEQSSNDDYRKNLESYIKNIIPTEDMLRSLNSVHTNVSKLELLLRESLRKNEEMAEKYERLRSDFVQFSARLNSTERRNGDIQARLEGFGAKVNTTSIEIYNNAVALINVSAGLTQLIRSHDVLDRFLQRCDKRLRESLANYSVLSAALTDEQSRISRVSDELQRNSALYDNLIENVSDYLNNFTESQKIVLTKIGSIEKQFNSSVFNVGQRLNLIRNNGVRGRLYLHEKIRNLSSLLNDYSEETESRLAYLARNNEKFNNSTDVLRQNIYRRLSDDQRNIRQNIEEFNSTLRILSLRVNLDEETWMEYDFKSNEEHNKCSGRRYIRRANVRNAKLIVGVVLCSSRRYKIFLSHELSDVFLDIGDGDGFGDEHCELLGGKSIRAPLKEEEVIPVFMTPTEGYQMDNFGDTPKKKTLTFLQSSPYWYECNVTIPDIWPGSHLTDRRSTPLTG